MTLRFPILNNLFRVDSYREYKFDTDRTALYKQLYSIIDFEKAEFDWKKLDPHHTEKVQYIGSISEDEFFLASKHHPFTAYHRSYTILGEIEDSGVKVKVKSKYSGSLAKVFYWSTVLVLVIVGLFSKEIKLYQMLLVILFIDLIFSAHVLYNIHFAFEKFERNCKGHIKRKRHKKDALGV